MKFSNLFPRLLFFLSVCILSCNDTPVTSDQLSSLSREEVLAFLKKYDDAWNKKNSHVVDSLYGKEYIYFTSVGGKSSRARNLEILAADYYKLIAANRSDVEVFIDGNTAVVSSRWQGHGTWKGEPFKDNQRCGLVIQRQGNQLKLITEHCIEITNEQVWD